MNRSMLVAIALALDVPASAQQFSADARMSIIENTVHDINASKVEARVCGKRTKAWGAKLMTTARSFMESQSSILQEEAEIEAIAVPYYIEGFLAGEFDAEIRQFDDGGHAVCARIAQHPGWPAFLAHADRYAE